MATLALSLAVAAAGAAAAEAAPVWKFDGHELVGEETVAGVGGPTVLTVPGATVTCAHVALVFKISNSAGHALGEMNEVPFYECTTAAKGCTVQSISAERLPWPMHVAPGPIGPVPKYYLVFEGVRISIEFSGELCALSGNPVRLKGSIGGQFSSSTLTFNKASYEATGTGLKVGTEKAELTGTFPLEAFGSHHGETLELS
ncbi:MAG TPA: hypothetical protein VK756_07975 [Solirubrobacteraceae bacterium]|nr:hypothetical protein [Solirubrobacteraceae bacterium]